MMGLPQQERELNDMTLPRAGEGVELAASTNLPSRIGGRAGRERKSIFIQT
jgi:hypothetical protein